MNSLYLQYGCGLSAPAGWRNFDASPTLRLQRLPLVGGLLRRAGGPEFPRNVEFGDIVRGLPLSEGVADGIYCSHVLEHLALEDCRLALVNTHKLLKPNGVFRLVLPDLEQQIAAYLSNGETDAVKIFMESTCLGSKQRPRGIGGLVKAWLGNSNHLWMWDYKSLSAELARTGFRDIRRAQFNDSADNNFLAVEDESRWIGGLGIECRR